MSIEVLGSVLVTGGAGYVGSHACKALSEAGFLPVTCDNLSAGNAWAVQWGPLEKGDISCRQWLDELIGRYKPIAVMHFAASAYVGESVSNPSKYYFNNVVNTLNLIEAMKEQGVDKLVFSSTCATYGIPCSDLIDEESPQAPINPYGASKLMIERILADYQYPYNFQSVSLRYFNAAGADVDGLIGECHDPETHLIPLAITAAQQRGDKLSIYGTDYPTPDGTAIRDYVHVSDLASGHVDALRYLLCGGKSCAINLGTGKGHSVLDVLSTIETISGLAVPVSFGERRPGDPPILVANPKQALSTLNWVPKYSRLNDIVRSAWNWHLNRRY